MGVVCRVDVFPSRPSVPTWGPLIEGEGEKEDDPSEVG